MAPFFCWYDGCSNTAGKVAKRLSINPPMSAMNAPALPDGNSRARGSRVSSKWLT
ncbi:hypothetical protein D3C81_2332500 [compost metagenome]